MQHYSAVNYWTPTWTYPRSRLREPFPRRRRGYAAAVLTFQLPLPSIGTPEQTFVAGPRGCSFAASRRGSMFSAPLRGIVFGS